METAIVSLVCIALMIFGGMTMSQGFLTSVDSSATRLEEMSDRGEQIMRTELSPASTSLNGARDTLTVNLENTGQTKLADFDKWDVIVQYYDGSANYYTKWLPYTDGALGDDEWTVQGIYLEGAAEAFEPNVVNPGETIRIEAKLNPVVGTDTTNLVVVSTPNGIPATTSFSP